MPIVAPQSIQICAIDQTVVTAAQTHVYASALGPCVGARRAMVRSFASPRPRRFASVHPSLSKRDPKQRLSRSRLVDCSQYLRCGIQGVTMAQRPKYPKHARTLCQTVVQYGGLRNLCLRIRPSRGHPMVPRLQSTYAACNVRSTCLNALRPKLPPSHQVCAEC